MLILILGFCSTVGWAVVNPRPMAGDSRIKIINYTPNAVFRYQGCYYYQSIIEFSLNEEIQTITMGTPTPWQIVPAGNRIFLKPVEENATTNMTVITNKRMYFFDMSAKKIDDINDSSLAYIVKFVYPSENNYSQVQNVQTMEGPDLMRPEQYNFNYKLSGDSHNIEPLQVFNDRRFTYFKFREDNADMPGIWLVNKDASESLINYRVDDKGYIVVERVAARFTLRHGKDTICVFNENLTLGSNQ